MSSIQDSIWNWTLTPREKDVQRTLFKLLEVDDLVVFSADDFFRYGLDRFFSDPAHMVGSFFRKLAHQGLIEHAGYMHSTRPSNNGREQKMWKVVGK